MRSKFAGWGLLVAIATVLLVPSAEAKGLPLKTPACGATITESFRLADDKTCTSDGFVIGASGVIVDLNGHTIGGDGDPEDAGIRIGVGKDAVVRNGVIRHFGSGFVAGVASKRWTGSNLIAVDSTNNGFFLGSNGVLKKSTAVAGDIGIQVQADGATLSGNRIANNTGLGIELHTSGNVVKKNQVASNSEGGISVIFGDDNVLSGNTVAGNGHAPSGAPGILVTGDNNITERNLIFGNADDGYRDTGEKNIASQNTTNGNGFLNHLTDGIGTGVDASAATAPKGGGNRSFGNDAATSCVPSTMCSPLKTEKLPLKAPACGSTVVDSFRLSQNKACTGDGFVVGKSGITIDLNGHTISGDGGNADTGIEIPSPAITGVTVRNGTVRNFGEGVADDGAKTQILDVTAVRNYVGFKLEGANTVAKRTTAVLNGNIGHVVFGSDVAVSQARSSLNSDGIYVNPLSSNVLVRGSTLVRNRVGLTVVADGTTVEDNIIFGSGYGGAYDGLLIKSGSLGNTVARNLIVGTTGNGYLDEGGATEIIENVALANGYDDGLSDGVDTGIDASGAALVEGGGNVSRGNDAAAQCLPAFLCT